ncbi:MULTISPECIES: hypothetical protein [Streptomyces]|uniref:Uncharacterized protein n=1 Tax=Streptomyces dengpaensis TaxID=2049881 RepID=A0ABM6T0Z7_9ACTN|nr:MULTISPECIES: hypothetical protein [Streptomyces]AVH60831.1 hypothetical protein C4B68_39525 [Streptomyces dengpaensis]PIB02719.1 hypothetical protein B1C81_37800 [Streptomyces sp. HG99]
MIPGGPVSPALRTQGGAKLTDRNDGKSTSSPGYYGDLAVLSDDFFTAPEQDVPHIESLPNPRRRPHRPRRRRIWDAEPPAISPQWSPVLHFGGYQVTVKPSNSGDGLAELLGQAVAESEQHRQWRAQRGFTPEEPTEIFDTCFVL